MVNSLKQMTKMTNSLKTPTKKLKKMKQDLLRSIKQYKNDNPLMLYTWMIDFSNSIGQKEAKIAPLLFTSRSAARKHNSSSFPKGKVVKIKPIQLMK